MRVVGLFRRIVVAVALAVVALAAVRARADEPATLRIATVAPDGTPWSEGLQRFKAMVEKDTQGRVVVRPFLGGVLGDEQETVGSCLRGQIQGVGASTGAIASVVPELAVLELPFTFKNTAE